MTDLRGYGGKILRVNLTSGMVTATPTTDYAEKFVGGRGIAAKIYWDEVPRSAGALEPENRLIFAVGPLAGFPVVGGSRWTVCCKSPATKPEEFSGCNLGGYWGAQLKFAGYDAIVVHGQSHQPVYLLIEDDRIEIRDAAALWGKTAIEARESLKSTLGNSIRVVACGPAGENLIPFATLLADNDASGSNGIGAVMGSKRLKAIAVRGSGRAAAAKPERFRELCDRIRKLMKDGGVRPSDMYPGEMISGPESRLKRDICYGCLGPCMRMRYQAKDGTTGKFCCGSALFYLDRALRYYGERNDVPFFASRLCNAYGVDTSAIYGLMIWLGKCHEAGILSEENTGIPLSENGSLEFIETLVRKVARREGFGELLAEGPARAAELVGQGTKEYVPYYIYKDGKPLDYCPRMYPTHGLLYALDARQPIHQLHEVGMTLLEWLRWVDKGDQSYLSSDVFRRIAKRFWGSELAADFSTYEGKALAATKIQNRQTIKESLILCDFWWPILSVRHTEDHIGDPTLESQLYSAVSGRELSEDDLYGVGERIFNLQRAIHIREGRRGRADDSIPESMFTIPLKNSSGNPECLAPGKEGEMMTRRGFVVDRAEFETMKDEFYRLRGWDVATGLQSKSKLRELALQEVVEDLEGRDLVV